jgi:hypothetical protein
MSHYVTLTNTGSRGIYPKNRGNNFTNQLARPLDLSDGNWEVALCDIVVPDITNNVSDGSIFWKLPGPEPVDPLLDAASDAASDADDEEEEAGIVPKGKYTTRGLLLKIKQVAKKLGLTYDFNETVQKVSITVFIEGKQTATRPVELRAREDKFFVHTDIIDPILFGDRLQPALWSGSMADFKGVTTTRYMKVNRPIIDSIKIDIKTLSGSYIDIARRAVVLVLHFRHV